VLAGFEDGKGRAAAENVLVGTIGAGNADGADYRHAVDDRNGPGSGQDPATV
jgi:hypothetical protein